MSFKREGNDKNLLDNLRRRRIKELFAEDIPEDEAKLLCNGRFACLVCNHNPIFDTVNMLMVHRQGKKHAAGEAEFLRKKKELRALVLKRKHEQYVKDGTTNIKQAASTSTGSITTAQPYDPRVKKQKLKPHERRPRLDMLPSNPVPSCESQHQGSSGGAYSWIGSLGDGPIKHSQQLKNIFHPPQRPQLPFQPYVSHRHGSMTASSAYDLPTSQPVVSSETCFQAVSVNSEQRDTVTPFNQTCVISVSSGPQLPVSHSLPGHSDQAGSQEKQVSVSGSKRKNSVSCISGGVASLAREISSVEGSSSSLKHKKLGGTKRSGTKLRTADKDKSVGTSSDNTLAQKYHQLGGSGWKRDWDGKWIRDEEAEFDSDEEPPDLS
ncbi:hypothetical protein V1264_003264 [Littorina saxatilis]|uniref:Sodium channel modifier 1 n=2 Tax=Littorina saxatilis TaxID=31220 RepID=A0AAN9B580_9CAEN